MPPHICTDPICRDRIRYIRDSFGWVDHRLVREKYIDHCSTTALAVYLFLVTVANADGVSYWSDKAICQRLHIGLAELSKARQQLLDATLIAYKKPLWQLLQLPSRKSEVNP